MRHMYVVFSILDRFLCEESQVVKPTLSSLVTRNKRGLKLVKKGFSCSTKRLGLPYGGLV
jgi:hypothetical protein